MERFGVLPFGTLTDDGPSSADESPEASPNLQNIANQ